MCLIQFFWNKRSPIPSACSMFSLLMSTFSMCSASASAGSAASLVPALCYDAQGCCDTNEVQAVRESVAKCVSTDQMDATATNTCSG
ncbi:hypothetical protein GUITHDRAFT_103187 [Guillardia theta CCMP2712]|uniref:Uncharacterized protein n=1 Tax=Guillardia theta (strain CCMP2712) TaxID=905079 RepID=L1JSX9_GUITC|nr:hypothetical protein GUITHDRAFT_103187 [Guillardia theta CCMP2712]EKX51270.1 hypothetical protein GUITHDRAFT_103187 [Guillardia theta CCMP2712]|eukprot:XP_005838250.1 hypothetical protein GUITHDRAFT_103187 [Guillardia theta CCMP2712]